MSKAPMRNVSVDGRVFPAVAQVADYIRQLQLENKDARALAPQTVAGLIAALDERRRLAEGELAVAQVRVSELEQLLREARVPA